MNKVFFVEETPDFFCCSTIKVYNDEIKIVDKLLDDEEYAGYTNCLFDLGYVYFGNFIDEHNYIKKFE